MITTDIDGRENIYPNEPPIQLLPKQNLMVPDGLQGKYKKKKQIEDYHKNKLKLRKKGLV